jgi:DegV family protein with EDD domain
MSRIAIITDSTANLPMEWIRQYNVQVIPLKIHWGRQTFLDGVDITPDEFYARLSHSKSLPTISEPSIQEFRKAFENPADQSDGIFMPLISSGMSGTVASAQAAAREFSCLSVEILDTHTTSMGQVLILLAAARAAEQGKSLREVRCAANEVVQRLHGFFAMDTDKYFNNSGKISRTSNYLDNVLNTKPILFFNLEGKIDVLDRMRTKRKALQHLIAIAEEHAKRHPIHIGIAHANAPQEAQEFREEIVQRLNCSEIFTVEFSPAIGVHMGPGTIGIAFYTEDIKPERKLT